MVKSYSMNWYRNGDAARRYAERKKREDDAPRLSEVVPGLESLRLDVQQGTSTDPAANPEGSHVRRIVVDNAPALFVITCHDKACKDGGHDVTTLVMQALRARKEHFEGQKPCMGQVGSGECRRVLRFVGTATYRD